MNFISLYLAFLSILELAQTQTALTIYIAPYLNYQKQSLEVIPTGSFEKPFTDLSEVLYSIPENSNAIIYMSPHTHEVKCLDNKHRYIKDTCDISNGGFNQKAQRHIKITSYQICSQSISQSIMCQEPNLNNQASLRIKEFMTMNFQNDSIILQNIDIRGEDIQVQVRCYNY